MTQVDFYLLSQPLQHGTMKVAARLCAKLQSLKQNSLVVTNDEHHSTALDSLLWEYGDTNFISHDKWPNVAITPGVVNCHIVEQENLAADVSTSDYDVLINLSQIVPGVSKQFSRVADIVDCEESEKSRARERYRDYKNKGFKIVTHEIDR